VDVADQTCHELAHARRGLGTHRVDDIVGEFGVEPVSCHFGVYSAKSDDSEEFEEGVFNKSLKIKTAGKK
jgi:hypothetical protein